jgi:hypothetical protein
MSARFLPNFDINVFVFQKFRHNKGATSYSPKKPFHDLCFKSYALIVAEKKEKVKHIFNTFLSFSKPRKCSLRSHSPATTQTKRCVSARRGNVQQGKPAKIVAATIWSGSLWKKKFWAKHS